VSVYQHPSKPGWQMIKISHGRGGKAEYIPYQGEREEAQRFERELRGLVNPTDPGFLDLLPDFKLYYRNQHSRNAYLVVENSCRHLERFFGGFKMRHLTPTLIEQYKAKRLEEGRRPKARPVSKRTINIELSALSAYISWQNQQHGTNWPRPRRFGKRETRPPMPQVLIPAEVAAILALLAGDIRIIVALMALSGLRREEALRLEARNVDLAGRVIRIHGKGGKWRIVPISGDIILHQLAERCRERPTGPLFISPRTGRPWVDIRKPIRRAANAAGITKHINPHLFRHSFGAALVNGGADIRVIQELLGHSEIATTQIYTQVAGAAKRLAVERLVAMVATPATLEPPGLPGDP
jgi:site-specific recombinase XerD